MWRMYSERARMCWEGFEGVLVSLCKKDNGEGRVRGEGENTTWTGKTSNNRRASFLATYKLTGHDGHSLSKQGPQAHPHPQQGSTSHDRRSDLSLSILHGQGTCPALPHTMHFWPLGKGWCCNRRNNSACRGERLVG